MSTATVPPASQSVIGSHAPMGLDEARPSRGRRLPLPQSRRLVTDLLHFSQQIPTQSLVRHFRIPQLAQLQRRRDGFPRVSWSALFLRGYGLLSARRPELRRCYLRWPWPHLYEHPTPIARMTVARKYAGQEWVFFAHVAEPDLLNLPELHREIQRCKHTPVEAVERFRLQVFFSRFPTLLRRLAWWWTLNISGERRANRFGTFGMTTVSALGAISVHPPSIPATTLTYGPVDEAGNVRVTIVYDHRLMDGATVAACLEELETILNSELTDELLALRESFYRTSDGNGRRSVDADPSDERMVVKWSGRVN